MNDELTVIGMVIFGVILGSAVGYGIAKESMHREAVERGHAQYHPKTGDWEWLEVKEVNQ